VAFSLRAGGTCSRTTFNSGSAGAGTVGTSDTLGGGSTGVGTGGTFDDASTGYGTGTGSTLGESDDFGTDTAVIETDDIIGDEGLSDAGTTRRLG
jgi:hypothetical protein